MKSFTQFFAASLLLSLPIITHADGVIPLGPLFVMGFFILFILVFFVLLIGGTFDIKGNKNRDNDE